MSLVFFEGINHKISITKKLIKVRFAELKNTNSPKKYSIVKNRNAIWLFHLFGTVVTS